MFALKNGWAINEIENPSAYEYEEILLNDPYYEIECKIIDGSKWTPGGRNVNIKVESKTGEIKLANTFGARGKSGAAGEKIYVMQVYLSPYPYSS